MSNALYIRLPATPDAPLAAYRHGPAPAAVHERYADAAVDAGGRVIALAPGADVLLTETNLPTRNRKRMLTAVPFALEEQLISDIDNLHFAIGPAVAGQPVPVAVVDRARMQTWLASLQQAGVQPELLIPEVLAVPYAAGTWSVLLEAHQALVRTGLYQGFAAEPELLEALLGSALDAAGDTPPAHIAVYGSAGPELKALAAARELALIEHPLTDVPALLSHHINEVASINLLQGSFSRNEQLQRLWRPWRLTAALAALWLLVLVGGRMVEYYQLTAARDALRDDILSLYKQTFPQDRSVRDPHVQMERHLAEMQSGGTSAGLLDLLARSGPALKATEALELKALRSQGGELELELSIKDLQALDDLKQRLSDNTELSVDIVSATARDGKVEGRLKIRSKS